MWSYPRSCPLIQHRSLLLLNTTSNQDQHFDLSLNLHNISGAPILSQTPLDFTNPGPASSSIFGSSHSLTQLQYEETLVKTLQNISPPNSKSHHRYHSKLRKFFSQMRLNTKCSNESEARVWTKKETWGAQGIVCYTTYFQHIGWTQIIFRQFNIVQRAHCIAGWTQVLVHWGCKPWLRNAPIKILKYCYIQ